MNRLARVVKKLDSYPNFVRSFAIGRTVPLVGTAGIQFEEMTTERVVVSIKNRRKVRNHIKQVHAAAMMLLAETATGMVLGMSVPDDKIPLVKSITTRFVRRSKGAMRAEAWLTEAQIQKILTEPKGEVLISVKVQDESGQAPIECEMLWAWIPKKK